MSTSIHNYHNPNPRKLGLTAVSSSECSSCGSGILGRFGKRNFAALDSLLLGHIAASLLLPKCGYCALAQPAVVCAVALMPHNAAVIAACQRCHPAGLLPPLEVKVKVIHPEMQIRETLPVCCLRCNLELASCLQSLPCCALRTLCPTCPCHAAALDMQLSITAKHHTHAAVSMAPWPIQHPAHNTIARGTTHRARALGSGAVNGISAWQIMASLIWPRFAVGSLTSTQCCREGWIQHHAACLPSPLHPRHDEVMCSHPLRLL